MSSESLAPLPNNIAISVRNLTKTYRLFAHSGDRVKQFLTCGIKRYHREFTALKDVSFDINRGESVGIIGVNGSGKSTLLQLICGILKPTSGSIKVNGRISALLELGAGFNPEFTGRENVHFHGALTGFTQAQMDEKFDEIAAFADIGEFINQPVRTYSSGMFVRLAFAVAIHVEPDILVLDEALAVGDRTFQKRCLEKIDALRMNGCTILLVSHTLEQVAHHCGRTLLLERGSLIAFDDTASTLNLYLERLEGRALQTSRTAVERGTAMHNSLLQYPNCPPADEKRWGDGRAGIIDVRIIQDGVPTEGFVKIGRELYIEMDVAFLSEISNPIYGITIKSSGGAEIYSVNSKQLSDHTSTHHTGERVMAQFRITPCFEEGEYLFSFGVVSETQYGITPHDRRYDALRLTIHAPHMPDGTFDLNPKFVYRTVT